MDTHDEPTASANTPPGRDTAPPDGNTPAPPAAATTPDPVPATGSATAGGTVGPSPDLERRAAALSSRLPPETGPVTIAGYEIIREVARGGMGVVYEARHTRLNRRAALKVVLNSAFADNRALI